MPHHNASAIANEFLKRMAKDNIPSQIVIQKLTYMAHGWCLAITGEPLVSEHPQAWDNGPVFRSIWNIFKEYGFGKQSGLLEDPNGQVLVADLSPIEKDIIEHVWKRYGHLSGRMLSDMTHRTGTPWFKAYFNRGRNAELDPDDIRQHYIELAMAARDRNS